MTSKKMFIAMPYGVRTGRLNHEDEQSDQITIDFDEVWGGVIKPAIPSDFEIKRADELRQPGLIDKLYIEWLFNADVVLMDITFGNPNVYYELGIRHVLSKNGTVIIAQEGTKPPFDVRNQFILNYNNFRASSLSKFHSNLKEAISNASKQQNDSPVHILLPGLEVLLAKNGENLSRNFEKVSKENSSLKNEIALYKLNSEEQRFFEKLRQATNPARILSLFNQLRNRNGNSITLLEEFSIKLRKVGLFNEAIILLEDALDKFGDDADIFRELGFTYRKLGKDHFDKAELFFKKAIKINPKDPELLGMLVLCPRNSLTKSLNLGQY